MLINTITVKRMETQFLLFKYNPTGSAKNPQSLITGDGFELHVIVTH